MIFNVFSSLSLLVMFGGERFRVFFFFFFGKGNNDAEGPGASAPADNDDARR